MAELPFGFHQSAASRPKCSASCRSIVALVAFAMAASYQAVPSSPRPGNKQPAMARIVMKFGGTSMAGIERIRSVAARIKREWDAGNQVAVVVSAMAGETDR